MIENVSTQLTVFHCFAHCLLPGRAFASLYVLLFLEKEAEIGGRVKVFSENIKIMSAHSSNWSVGLVIFDLIQIAHTWIKSWENFFLYNFQRYTLLF